MMPYGERLSILKKQVVIYIEEKIKEGAYDKKLGDLVMLNGNGLLTSELIGGMRLKDCKVEKLCALADSIHFKPLEHLRGAIVSNSKKLIETEKTQDMNFEIKTDIPVPAKFAEKLDSKPISAKTKTGRINYSNLPLRAMKRGESIVLFENLSEDKISSRKYTAVTGIRRISNIMGLPNSFHVDIADGNKICVWRVA